MFNFLSTQTYIESFSNVTSYESESPVKNPIQLPQELIIGKHTSTKLKFYLEEYYINWNEFLQTIINDLDPFVNNIHYFYKFYSTYIELNGCIATFLFEIKKYESFTFHLHELEVFPKFKGNGEKILNKIKNDLDMTGVIFEIIAEDVNEEFKSFFIKMKDKGLIDKIIFNKTNFDKEVFEKEKFNLISNEQKTIPLLKLLISKINKFN